MRIFSPILNEDDVGHQVWTRDLLEVRPDGRAGGGEARSGETQEENHRRQIRRRLVGNSTFNEATRAQYRNTDARMHCH